MEKNSLLQDLTRGLTCRCPQCGQGRMFHKWLKVADHCDVCGEEFHHHRADDFPAYLVIAIVGHIMVPFSLSLEKNFAPPYWVHLVTAIPLTLFLSVFLLQPVKGAVVAIQWRIGMHGFGTSRKNRVAD